MYKNLNTTTQIEKNKAKVNKIKDKLTDLVVNIENDPTNHVKKFRNRNSMVRIVNLTLESNQLNQSGKSLKILTTSQMLSRLPISLAQLKAGNNSEKLNTKLVKNCIICTDKKNFQKMLIKVWLTLFKHGNIQNTTIISLKYLLLLGVIFFICLMVLIKFLTFRITLNLSTKNTKL